MITRRVAFDTLVLAVTFWGFAAQAQTNPPAFTVLYSFPGGSDGAVPKSGLVMSGSRVLYGTTWDGGKGGGTVYALTHTASGVWNHTVLQRFSVGGADGKHPDAIALSNAVLYGTTHDGGTAGFGTVFSVNLESPGSGSIIYNFAGATGDGANPDNLVIAGNGVIFGTTYAGGTMGQGTVFSLAPPGAGSPPGAGGTWTETVIHNFLGGPADGANPQGVTLGDDGVLYGTTQFGGNSSCFGYSYCGTVFSLAPPSSPGGAWTETVLQNFDGLNGVLPPASVSIGKNGVLYGISGYDTDADSTAFSLKPPVVPGGSWIFSILNSVGIAPCNGLAIGKNGALYGGTLNGGDANAGLIFSLTPPAEGGPWPETVLYSFSDAPASYSLGPSGKFVIGPEGTIYGATDSGGASNQGMVFSLVP